MLLCQLLVRRLITGWVDGSQKSIFLVGDPMQSIYRFRQSEVGLFKQVADAGFIGNMSVELLSLSVNFRSQGSLVHWVNKIIPLIVREAGQSESYFEAQKVYRGSFISRGSIEVFICNRDNPI